MAFDNLLIERDARVAIVTINRPKVLNALNAATLDELRRAILDFKKDESIRVVVVTGGGDKSFVAGADVNELAVQSPSSGRDHAHAGQHTFDLIENMGKPVIAAINGYALGGGCELGLEMPFAEGCAYETTLIGLSAATDDMREGTRAFLEKRQPVFHGR